MYIIIIPVKTAFHAVELGCSSDRRKLYIALSLLKFQVFTNLLESKQVIERQLHDKTDQILRNDINHYSSARLVNNVQRQKVETI